MSLIGVYDIFNERWGQQTAWIYSDPHFEDKELAAALPNRPSAQKIVENINSKVGRKDTFICLGDIGDVEYVRQVRGYKVLICGNHDLGASNYKRQILKYEFDSNRYTKEQAKAEIANKHPNWKITIDSQYCPTSSSECLIVYADNLLFDEVYTGPLMIGEKLILSHEPIPNLNWAMNIHGHVHDSKAKSDMYHFNCCADVIDFTPLNLNQLLKKGLLSKVQTVHRETINAATKRARKRQKRK